jgi:hypothetical protein
MTLLEAEIAQFNARPGHHHEAPRDLKEDHDPSDGISR